MAKKKASKSRSESAAPPNEPHSPQPSTLSVVATRKPGRAARGTGGEAAGQSGALQGLHRRPDADSQSVEELVEEGQSHEADVISGVENAPDPDQDEVRTHPLPSKPGESKSH